MDMAIARGRFDDELLVEGELVFSPIASDCDGMRLRIQLISGDTSIAANYNFSVAALASFDRCLSAVRCGRQQRAELDDEDESFRLVVRVSTGCDGSVWMTGEFFIPLISVGCESRYASLEMDCSEWINAVVGSGIRVMFSRLRADADAIAAFQRDLSQMTT